jgi:putative phosphoesterase
VELVIGTEAGDIRHSVRPVTTMRVLLISDLHANWPALQAIDEPFDLCLCIGDLVDYGCQPVPVIDWVRRNAVCVRGNHDHAVAQNIATHGVTGFKYLSGVTRPVSRERISESDCRFLARLPVTKYLSIDGKTFLLVHATPRDPLDEYAGADQEFWRRRLQRVEADVVCVGHSHQAFELEIDGVKIINPGSVGLSRDGDPRASYVIWENGSAAFKRVEYDVEQTVRAVEDSPLPEQAKQMLAQVYRTGIVPNGSHKPANGLHSKNGVYLQSQTKLSAPGG